MNKFGFALTLVVAMVGIAAAHEHLGSFNHHLGHQGGLHRGGFEGGYGGGLESFNDELLLEELSRRERLGGYGGGHRGGLRGPRLGRRSGFGGRSGLGGAAIGGAGFRNSENSLGALNAGSHDFESGLAEKGQAGLLAGKKDFEAGQHLNNFNDNSGLHKHQVLNSDKTIIKDRTTGVNDVDSFHTRNGLSQGSNVRDNEAGVAAGISGSKIAGERENDKHFNALNAQNSNTAAGIAGAGIVA